MIDIVGISGKAGSGKDYIGEHIFRPRGFKQWAFAWPMKHEAVGPGLFAYDDVFVHKPAGVRDFLQQRGTEDGWMKHGKQYWCRIAGAWLRTIHEQWGVNQFYFADVRFDHEVEFIRSMGGAVIRVEAGMGIAHALAGGAAEHSSETALDGYDGWDAVVVNHRDANNLRNVTTKLRDCGVLKEEWFRG